MSDGTFDLNQFIRESKDVLVNPKSYFSTMQTSGGMTEPLIKAVIYGAIAGIFTLIWSLLRFGAMAGGLFGRSVGVMAFIWAIIGAIIGLFIGTVILLVITSICKGNTGFEANARVTAAAMVLMPINAFFGFLVHFSPLLGTVVSLVIGLYSLWILYNGLIEALKSDPAATKTVTYILVVILAIFVFLGYNANKKAQQFMKDFNDSDVKEMMKDMPKN